MTTTLIPVLCGLVAVGVAILVTPLAGRLARLIGAVDEPSGRRIHTTATPLLGGIGIMVGVLVPAVYYLPDDAQSRGLLVGAVLLALIGVIDDWLGLEPVVKLVGQVAAAAVPASAGLTIDHITLPVFGVHDLGTLEYPVTILWFVAIVNMINFIDGMDGLAAGVAGLAAVNFAIIAASLNRADAAILAASIAGACLGFLVFNFHPAKIFMGDTGSMFLGFLVAGVAINGVMKSAAAVALIAPLLVLAIPILDTSFVILKRIKHGRPVYAADRSHFHHRFFTIGWGQRKTVLALYGWCLLMGGVAMSIRFVPYRNDAGELLWVGTAVIGASMVLALAAAVYLIYVLEILKWRSTPVVNLVRDARAARSERLRSDRSQKTPMA
ncbi:MAG: undecaprenyl/decaprenyl-phosphate alpha-N-acetylglucosaminyl 1-phosphate transferase [Actinobacteria bacterium]|nr:undecaprenyl/decaprenyl-phosphate alpha-N-acetylglucosaminyl 1-phosphate transferase [Thermoleophilia bacterium]MCB9010572.1 undecaprenyl/decaprenyl-phosphate alpha-N-acetylglucosaminyl 1-phosphate transferase [Actinomycetota bacterium]